MNLNILRLTRSRSGRSLGTPNNDPKWTEQMVAQLTPRPARSGPPPEPVEVVGGTTVYSEAIGGHRIELLEITAGGFVVVVDGDIAETLPNAPQSAAAAFGRYVGSTDPGPALRLVEA